MGLPHADDAVESLQAALASGAFGAELTPCLLTAMMPILPEESA
jgi:hypothetical protein